MGSAPDRGCVRRRIAAALALAVAAAAFGAFVGSRQALAAAPARSPSLALGFDDPAFALGDGARLDAAAALGSSIVRVPSGWAALSPRRPAVPTDPADPAYDWSQLDAAVRAADGRGLRVLISLTGTPAWAEGPRRPAAARPGTWRPDPVAYGWFATALTTRYAGRSVDAGGVALPRAYAFQPWNEPNLDAYLAPQWTPGLQPASPRAYLALHNAFYRGVKAVAPRALVVAAGTAPYGDLPGGDRIAPARFWRAAFGLTLRLRRQCCVPPMRLDALDHHPYSVGSPRRRALNRDDVAIPDVGKLARIVQRAVATGQALPRRHKRLWVTEFSWDSHPPDPGGVPETTHAAWLQDALDVLWRQGVDTAMWFQVRDQLPRPSYSATYQSGVLLADGRPKLAARAFRLPLVLRATRAGASVFSRAPGAGTMLIQRAGATGWQTIARATLWRDQVLLRRVAARRGDRIRLVFGATTSMVRRVGGASGTAP